MYTRQTVLMFAGLVLVGLNAMVAGHWLSIKSTVTSAAGSPAPTLSIGNLASDAAGALGNRLKDQAKKQIVDPTKNVVDPTPGTSTALGPNVLTPGNIGKIKNKILGLLP